MGYSINIRYLIKEIEMEKAAHIVSKVGFTELDYTPVVKNDDWESEMLKNMKIFEKENLRVHQTHAPFNRYDSYGSGDIHIKLVERALKATECMGAEYMVVHGDEFDFEKNEYSPEKALQHNYELFAPIVEKAAAKNIGIAFENVFQDDYKNRTRFCSKAEELKALIEKFNSDNVCCCWDFGHAGVAFKENQPEKIKELGKYIKCTHLQDCGHGMDMHLPPFLGDTNWRECAAALKEINYSGKLSFEFVYGVIPEELAEAFAGSMIKTADYLTKLMI